MKNSDQEGLRERFVSLKGDNKPLAADTIRKYMPSIYLLYGDQVLDALRKGQSERLDALKAKTTGINLAGDEEKQEDVDDAMVSNEGGIDFMNLQVKMEPHFSGKENESIKFHVDAAMLQQLQNASGLELENIDMQPVRDLKGFLEGAGLK